MADINNRAIFNLVALQQALAEVAPHMPAIAFAGDLVNLLEADKPGVISIGDERYNFEPAEVRVNGTLIEMGSLSLAVTTLTANDNGEYETVMLVDEVNLLGETVPVVLEAA